MSVGNMHKNTRPGNDIPFWLLLQAHHIEEHGRSDEIGMRSVLAATVSAVRQGQSILLLLPAMSKPSAISYLSGIRLVFHQGYRRFMWSGACMTARRFSALYLIGSNSSLVTHSSPNPAAQPAKLTTGMANEAGVQQALAKVSSAQPSGLEWLKRAVNDILDAYQRALPLSVVRHLRCACPRSTALRRRLSERRNAIKTPVCALDPGQGVIHRSFQPLRTNGLRRGHFSQRLLHPSFVSQPRGRFGRLCELLPKG